MKKQIIISLLSISVCFAGDITPAKAVNTYVCPDLTIINENKEEIKGLKEALIGGFPTIYETYSNLIKYINKTEESDKYMSSENLKELGASLIWGYMIGAAYQENEEVKNNLNKQIYESIDLKDPNWCNKKIDFK